MHVGIYLLKLVIETEFNHFDDFHLFLTRVSICYNNERINESTKGQKKECTFIFTSFFIYFNFSIQAENFFFYFWMTVWRKASETFICNLYSVNPIPILCAYSH